MFTTLTSEYPSSKMGIVLTQLNRLAPLSDVHKCNDVARLVHLVKAFYPIYLKMMVAPSAGPRRIRAEVCSLMNTRGHFLLR